MDLDDLFDVGNQPKIKLKGSTPRHVHIDLAKDAAPSSAQIADVLQDDPGDCPYGSPDEEGVPEDMADLDVDVATRAKTAAEAHDAYTSAKATYDLERSQLQKEVDEKLAKLKEAMLAAKTAREEAVAALGAAMKKDKITTIPMTDRPDIRIKSGKGKKLGITKKWLVDPEHVAVKAYEEALAGEPSIKTGKEFATKIWDEQPKSEASETVVVPDAYEDEPDHN